jgi:hypothetical protein
MAFAWKVSFILFVLSLLLHLGVSIRPSGTKNYDPAIRIQAIIWLEFGWSVASIITATGIGRATIYKTRKKAITRGWKLRSLLRLEHVADSVKTGRPSIIIDQKAKILLSIPWRNSTTREYSTKREAEIGRGEYIIPVAEVI